MKRLLLILLGAFAVFMVLAMVQEWQIFASALFDHRPPAPTLSGEDHDEAEKALRYFLTLSRHIYQSNGDPRFFERLPAGDEVAADLMADIVYLRHNGRYQENVLQRLEIEESRLLSPGNIEFKTQEFWIFHTRSLEDGTQTDPVRSTVVDARYWLSKEGPRWVVRTWELLPPKAQAIECS